MDDLQDAMQDDELEQAMNADDIKPTAKVSWPSDEELDGYKAKNGPFTMRQCLKDHAGFYCVRRFLKDAPGAAKKVSEWRSCSGGSLARSVRDEEVSQPLRAGGS